MPRFRFDVSTNGVTVEDKDGLDLLSAGAARLEATRAASEMMRDFCARNSEPADVSIVVRDGSPEPVCTVQVALKIQ
jgi:hypothetical protein